MLASSEGNLFQTAMLWLRCFCRGKGVSVVPQREALSHALTHKHERHSSTSSSSSGGGDDVQYLNVLVQSYLQQQLVIAGRSSYIRVWLLVTSINPLRAYLFDGGFAIFGKQKGAAGAAGAAARGGNKTAGSSSDDLIVNLWIQDRDSSPIWSLKHLQEYLAQHPEVVLPLPAPEQRPQQQPQSAQRGRRLQQPATAAGSSSSSAGHGSSRALQQQQQSQTQQRRTFADAWKDMQTSASLVLAAALPAMRSAAAEANAPQQGTFEYFGLDFVLDAHLQPWMLEVNAIPSMARRKKSECSGEAATAHCKLKTAGPDSAAGASNSSSNSSSAGGKAASDSALDDFDAQKERFVHDMLLLLGLPVGGGVADAAAAAAAAAATAGPGGHSEKVPADGEGLLRLAAAAAAAAGIRSPPPPTAAAPAAAASSSSSTDRRLLSTAAGPARPQEGLHGELQRPWLLKRQREGQQRQLLQPRLHVRDALPTAGSAGPADSQNSSASTSSSSSGDDHRSQPAAPGGYKGVGGLHWSGPPPDIKQLPAQLQKLLCSPMSTTASSSSSSSSSAFACISCLTADDLAGLAAAEGELQRAGRFVPVHDLITAHSTNQEALKQAAAAGNSTHGSSSTAAGPAAGDSSAAAGAAGALPGSQYLSPSPSVWQKLYRAWKGLSRGGVGVGDLAVMQYYTTASTLSADKRLELQRLDYVMSAWLRVRREEGCAGLQGADCVVKRLSLLVSKCYLQ